MRRWVSGEKRLGGSRRVGRDSSLAPLGAAGRPSPQAQPRITAWAGDRVHPWAWRDPPGFSHTLHGPTRTSRGSPLPQMSGDQDENMLRTGPHR